MTGNPGVDEARSLPPAFYLGADWLATDLRAVFARGWQLAAHASGLAGAGDHVVTSVAGAPVLLVRGDDGVLRAFPNVCRHRAGPLALGNGRGARMLHCRYHGWTYGLDGQLKRAPGMADAAGFDPREIRLPALRHAQWLGLVFVSLARDPVPFAEIVAGIAERITPADFAPMRHLHSTHYDVACNWKVYVDNYVEGYHLPCVHAGLTQALEYGSYHHETARWHSLQHSPVAGGGAAYGAGHAWYYYLYPNTMLNVMPGRLQANRVLPLAPDRCRVEFHYYYLPDPQAEARIAADLAFTDRVQQEDAAICEQVQQGLASGFYEPGRLCPRHEVAVTHFHRLLLADYARDQELTA